MNELEKYIIATCEDIKEYTGLDIHYTNNELYLDDELFFTGTEKECGLVVAGMLIMTKIGKGEEHGTYKQ